MQPPQQLAPPAPLPDEIVEEILVRVPPDDPASLVRAAIACKRWCRLVAGPAFRRRSLELHRATPPPMLGVVCDGSWEDSEGISAQFVPTSSCRPPRGRALHHGMWSFDARHGRVLLHRRRSEEHSDMLMLVWDPITDQRVELPRPPCQGDGDMKATVLCPATGGACDHLDCHRGPFIVVLVGTREDIIIELDLDDDDDLLDVCSEDQDVFSCGSTMYRRVPKDMFSCVYSSETGAWSEPKYDDHPDDEVLWMRSALVGNALFFVLHGYKRILKYDLGTQQMSMIRLPYVWTDRFFRDSVPIQLTTLEDGRLGFARVEKSNELCLWSWGRGDDDVEGWTLCKVINLKDLFPLFDSIIGFTNCLVGFAESVCVAFMAVQGGLFTVDMKSGQMKKICEGSVCCAMPYINFCNPDWKLRPGMMGKLGISSALKANGVDVQAAVLIS